jgi:hypothetical protein
MCLHLHAIRGSDCLPVPSVIETSYTLNFTPPSHSNSHLFRRLSNTVFPLSTLENSSIPLCLSTLLSTVPFAFYSLSLTLSYKNTHVLYIIPTFPTKPPSCHSFLLLACPLLLVANTSTAVVPSHITQLPSP